MPRVIVTEAALQGLEKCRLFLAKKSPQASQKAAQLIKKHFNILETNPNIGRPYPDMPELRELIINFGTSGYIALYRYDPLKDMIYILAFKYQKEAGY